MYGGLVSSSRAGTVRQNLKPATNLENDLSEAKCDKAKQALLRACAGNESYNTQHVSVCGYDLCGGEFRKHETVVCDTNFVVGRRL